MKTATPRRSGPTPARPSGTVSKAGGISTAAVEKATGRTWDQWLAILDRFDVRKNGHAAAAEFVHVRHKCPPWWSQMVVVGYEQERGLREKHQTKAGYSVSASRVIAAPMERLWKAWTDPKSRTWLPGAKFTIRKATPMKSIRITWVDGETNVEAMFYDKSKGAVSKSQVAVQHNKLKTAAAAKRMKAFWGEALDRLRESLET
ncbi:hypothetical protein PHYC_01700 [Phycisphaerales bacterium]|nr:hypothetical protein PHYC_01700 [Phycisphaerales bacterium]